MAERVSRKKDEEQQQEEEKEGGQSGGRRLLERVSFFERIWKGTKISPSVTVDDAEEAFEFVSEETVERRGADSRGPRKKQRTASPVPGVVYREWEFVDVPKPHLDVDSFEKQIAERRNEAIQRSRSPVIGWRQNLRATPKKDESPLDELSRSFSPSDDFREASEQLRQETPSPTMCQGSEKSRAKAKNVSTTYIGHHQRLHDPSLKRPMSPRKDATIHRTPETLTAVLGASKASGGALEEKKSQEVYTVSYEGPDRPSSIDIVVEESRLVDYREADSQNNDTIDSAYEAEVLNATSPSTRTSPPSAFRLSVEEERTAGVHKRVPIPIPSEEEEPVSMESVSSIVCEGGTRKYSSKVIIRERDSYTHGREVYTRYLKKTRESAKAEVMTSEVLSTLEGKDPSGQKVKHDYQDHIFSMKGEPLTIIKAFGP